MYLVSSSILIRNHNKGGTQLWGNVREKKCHGLFWREIGQVNQVPKSICSISQLRKYRSLVAPRCMLHIEIPTCLKILLSSTLEKYKQNPLEQQYAVFSQEKLTMSILYNAEAIALQTLALHFTITHKAIGIWQ